MSNDRLMSNEAPWLDLPPGYQGLPLRTPTIPPAAHTNCYVIGHHQALVVDPGSSYPRELDRLRRLLYALRGTGGGVAAVFLTHHHHDHVGGAARIAREFDAPIAAHPLTLARLRARDLADVETLRVGEGSRMEVDPGRLLEALFTPGHAPGHLCLFEKRGGVLVAGDMIPGVGTIVIDPDEGEMKRYLDELSRLATLHPQTILPAHGPIREDGARGIEALIAHRLGREEKIYAALESDATELTEITLRAYDDVPPLMLGLASRSALAHLLKLEGDGRAKRSGGRWRRT